MKYNRYIQIADTLRTKAKRGAKISIDNTLYKLSNRLEADKDITETDKTEIYYYYTKQLTNIK